MMNDRFTRHLLEWNQVENRREMPWKGEKDPYRIWISEVILQQTRVEQGLAYYKKFISLFPTVRDLAAASRETVFKAWEGLGYYSRCRNLHDSAIYISSALDGKFPGTYEVIRDLKGVGPYTAAAISSFAFNLPYAVTDGNVYRVLSRVFGIELAIDSTAGKKYFSALAQDLLDKDQPAVYNQSIMDFGAMVCRPSNPLCNTCILNKECAAFLNNKTADLPVKAKKQQVKKRWFYYLVIMNPEKNKRFYYGIRKRTGRDIWQDLYEFPLYESEKPKQVRTVLALMEKNLSLNKGSYSVKSVSPLIKQKLSHQLISGRFISIELNPSKKIDEELLWIEKDQFPVYAFPQYINQFLNGHFSHAG